MTLRLCTICARGQSKGFKNKNIKDFFGKPMIAHIISIAQDTKLFEHLAISSDCDEILNIAKKAGVKHLIRRPDEMATDHAAKLPAIQHCASQVELSTGLKFDTFVDLSVTSPLMIAEDIAGAVLLLESSSAKNVITGSLSACSPYFSMVERKDERFVTLSKKLDKLFDRRQDAPISYDMNGAIYVWKREKFFELSNIITDMTLLYEMPRDRSVDIDDEIDFKIAKYLYKERSNGNIFTKSLLREAE